VTKDVPGEKRWEEERGTFVQIMYREEARHLAVFEIRKGSQGGAITITGKKRYSIFSAGD
jgi:hypothetical protein